MTKAQTAKAVLVWFGCVNPRRARWYGRRGGFMTRQYKHGDALLAGAMWAIPSALITLALVYLLNMPLLLIPGAIVTFGVAACIMLRDD